MAETGIVDQVLNLNAIPFQLIKNRQCSVFLRQVFTNGVNADLILLLNLNFQFVEFLFVAGHQNKIIALAGVSAEFGVIMLLYLKNAWVERQEKGAQGEADLLDAIHEGAVQRVRPKAMTVAVIIAGLLPILLGSGTGSEIMSRIAAPMVGGMITAPLLSLFVLPAAYLLMHRKRSRRLTTQPTKIGEN